MPVHLSPRRAPEARVVDQPFSLEDFGILVSTALDVQRVPDCNLAFSFGADLAPPYRRPRSRQQQEPRPEPSRSLSRFRGAFIKKQLPQQSQQYSPTPTQIHKLASTSVPHLSQVFLSLSSSSAQIASASVANLNDLRSGSATEPPSPNLSPEMPRSTVPYSPVSPPRTSLKFQNHIHLTNAYTGLRKTHIENSPELRPKTNAKSFLNLKPLAIPRLNKKRSKMFFSGSSALPTPDASFSAPSTSLPKDESDAMRSFFDDSGCEDESLHPFSRKRSGPKLRAFFSSGPGFTGKSKIGSRGEHRNREMRSLEKDLPPTPPLKEQFFSSHPYQLHRDSDSESDQPELESTLAFPSTIDRDLFYSLPAQADARSSPKFGGFDPKRDGQEGRTPRTSNPTPRKARRRLRSSPSPYPSPTSPLPPTPELSPVGLPAVSPPNSDHYHGEDRSIDSLEILAWRMPALQLQTSKTSSNSSAALEVSEDCVSQSLS